MTRIRNRRSHPILIDVIVPNHGTSGKREITIEICTKDTTEAIKGFIRMFAAIYRLSRLTLKSVEKIIKIARCYVRKLDVLKSLLLRILASESENRKVIRNVFY